MKAISTASTFSGGLKPGFHIGTITSVSEVTTNAKNGAWSDASIQDKIEITTPEGKATKYLHHGGKKRMEDLVVADLPLSAQKVIAALPPAKQAIAFEKIKFETFESRSSENGKENYAVNIATNQRVDDDARTSVAMRIAGEFMSACGIAEGTEADTFDTIGLSVGIEIRSSSNNAGKSFNDVYRFMSVDAAQAKIDAELSVA